MSLVLDVVIKQPYIILHSSKVTKATLFLHGLFLSTCCEEAAGRQFFPYKKKKIKKLDLRRRRAARANARAL